LSVEISSDDNVVCHLLEFRDVHGKNKIVLVTKPDSTQCYPKKNETSDTTQYYLDSTGYYPDSTQCYLRCYSVISEIIQRQIALSNIQIVTSDMPHSIRCYVTML
jgi:hypothetical protein